MKDALIMGSTVPLVTTAIVIGSSDGIGLALARRLLAAGWSVTGVSRGAGQLTDPAYQHVSLDVTDAGYGAALGDVCDRAGAVDLCVYCAGIGDELDLDDLPAQSRVFAVNLGGALATVDAVVPRMLAAGGGHFIGLSSLADQLISPEAPGYAASKAGLSAYLNGLALALRPRGVAVTTVRFGFVDTRMAKAARRPWMISADRAADLLMACVRTRPVQFSHPRRMAAATWLLRRLANARLHRAS